MCRGGTWPAPSPEQYPRERVPGAARECRKHLTCACCLALEAPRAPGQGSESPGLLLLLSHFSPVRLCDPTDGSPPGSSVPGILQARMLEWVAISFSSACMHAKSLQLCPTVQPHRRQPIGLLCPQDSLGKNTGVGFQGRGLEAPGSLGTGNRVFRAELASSLGVGLGGRWNHWALGAGSGPSPRKCAATPPLVHGDGHEPIIVKTTGRSQGSLNSEGPSWAPNGGRGRVGSCPSLQVWGVQGEETPTA